MLVDLDALRQHRAAIGSSEDGPFVSGAFEQLLTELQFAAATGTKRPPPNLVHDELRAVANRLGELRTIAWKLAWLLDCRDRGDLHPMMWMMFAGSDVVGFLGAARALFDHLGFALQASTGSVDRKVNFTTLRKQMALSTRDRKPVARFDTRLIDLVLACDWYDEIRDIRNTITHEDTRTIVYPTATGIAVQVYAGYKHLLLDAALIETTSHTVRFEGLAAAVTARIHVLLESCASTLSEVLNASELRVDIQSRHGGLEVLAAWTDDYLSRVESPGPATLS